MKTSPSLQLELVESLLVALSASLSSRSGAPSQDCLFNSILAVQHLVQSVRQNLED